MPRAVPTTVCVIRHGHAGDHREDPRRDRARRLTAKGRRQSERAGAALARLGLRPALVCTSRLPRAVETAAYAMEAAGAKGKVARLDALEPDAPPAGAGPAMDAAWKAAAAKRTRRPRERVVWLVGHEPHLSRLVASWIGAQSGGVLLRKGAVAVVEAEGTPAAGSAHLLALWQPKQLERLRRAPRRRAAAR